MIFRTCPSTRASAQPRRTIEAGMTIVELLIVVAIIGILANLAIPALEGVLWRARAIGVVGDFVHVRQGAVEHYRDHNFFPKETPTGVVPPTFAAYVQAIGNWASGVAGSAYDWENWQQEDGSALYPDTGVIYGFTVIHPDPHLFDAIQTVYEGPILRIWDDRVTFIIDDGSFAGSASPSADPPEEPNDDQGGDDNGEDDSDDGDDGDSGNGNNNNGGNGNGGNGGNNGNGGNGGNGGNNGNNGNNGNGGGRGGGRGR